MIDWFQIGKGVRQDCMLSPCLFNLYAEYIMRNAGLDEAQAGIKIAGRNISNLRYADDTTLTAGSRVTEEPLDESERGEWKAGLKFNIQKTKIMASGPISSWQIDGETMETVTDFIFLGSKITADDECNHEIKMLASWRSSLVAQMVKHLPAIQETWVRSLGWEDPLEKEMATCSSTLAWKIPWIKKTMTNLDSVF